MKFILSSLVVVAICFLFSAIGDTSSAGISSWKEFKKRYNKVYETVEEDTLRQGIFEKSLLEIKYFNSLYRGSSSYERGINHLSDLRHEEYMRLNGLKYTPNEQPAKNSHAELLPADYTPPDSIDWSQSPNRVGPVGDQGQCGSCWAFATVGLIEGQEYRNSTASRLVELSEQNLIDCNELNYGCSGGTIFHAIEHIKTEEGIARESDYPYVSGSGEDDFTCKYTQQDAFVTTRRIRGSQQLDNGDEELLKKFVAKYGPVAVGIDASQSSFHDYKSGIYYDENCAKIPNHAVLVVGYGTDQDHGDYWIVKNSWSEDWGMKGYFRLARNRDNHCGVATMAIIAITP